MLVPGARAPDRDGDGARPQRRVSRRLPRGDHRCSSLALLLLVLVVAGVLAAPHAATVGRARATPPAAVACRAVLLAAHVPQVLLYAVVGTRPCSTPTGASPWPPSAPALENLGVHRRRARGRALVFGPAATLDGRAHRRAPAARTRLHGCRRAQRALQWWGARRCGCRSPPRAAGATPRCAASCVAPACRWRRRRCSAPRLLVDAARREPGRRWRGRLQISAQLLRPAGRADRHPGRHVACFPGCRASPDPSTTSRFDRLPARADAWPCSWRSRRRWATCCWREPLADVVAVGEHGAPGGGDGRGRARRAGGGLVGQTVFFVTTQAAYAGTTPVRRCWSCCVPHVRVPGRHWASAAPLLDGGRPADRRRATPSSALAACSAPGTCRRVQRGRPLARCDSWRRCCVTRGCDRDHGASPSTADGWTSCASSPGRVGWTSPCWWRAWLGWSPRAVVAGAPRLGVLAELRLPPSVRLAAERPAGRSGSSASHPAPCLSGTPRRRARCPRRLVVGWLALAACWCGPSARRWPSLPAGRVLRRRWVRPGRRRSCHRGSRRWWPASTGDALCPVLRPNEALVVCARRRPARSRAVCGCAPARAVPVRLDGIEVPAPAMALANSVAAAGLMLVRGRPIEADDISYALVLWKYLAVYAVVRSTVRTERAIRCCLWASMLGHRWSGSSASCRRSTCWACAAAGGLLRAVRLHGSPGRTPWWVDARRCRRRPRTS